MFLISTLGLITNVCECVWKQNGTRGVKSSVCKEVTIPSPPPLQTQNRFNYPPPPLQQIYVILAQTLEPTG